VCLAHDIGHPPFGHAGEDALRELMSDHSGFDHNIQGLRIVDLLEARYPGFPGLNLTWEVRESINKHRTPYSQPDMQVALDPDLSPLLESQIADVADEIAYDNHDLDDGLASGILKEESLSQLDLWRQAREAVEAACGGLADELRHYQTIRTLINRQVTDLIHATSARLEEHRIDSVEAVRGCRARLVGFSREMAALRSPLKKLLWEDFYQHYRIARMADKAKRFIGDIFHLYVSKPELLPPTTRLRIKRGDQVARVVCDYIAGMTDRYCEQEHKRLFDPFERV
jgi:dGTPase